jgi:DNA-dependent RNA polymerase auxiliary subunit epsilon
MEKFQLEVFLILMNLGAASGLVYTENAIYLISDSSSYLYLYSFATEKTTKIELTTNAQETIEKKNKPDFESITLVNDQLYLFGSGSGLNRNQLITYNLKTGKIAERNIQPQHDSLQNKFGISADDYNIEGVVYYHQKTFLFQRGNGPKAQNGIFILNDTTKEVNYHPIELPELKGVKATFTDAVLVEDAIYFLAAAEKSASTYLDGEVTGSIIGKLNPETLNVDFTQKISDTHKFEGITLYKKTTDSLEFILCEDKDSEDMKSTIYKLTIKKTTR